MRNIGRVELPSKTDETGIRKLSLHFACPGWPSRFVTPSALSSKPPPSATPTTVSQIGLKRRASLSFHPPTRLQQDGSFVLYTRYHTLNLNKVVDAKEESLADRAQIRQLSYIQMLH